MTPPVVNRYSFYTIFRYAPDSTYLFPDYKVIISGTPFSPPLPIPRGPVFGGLDLYSVMGKDIAGTWDDIKKELTIVGFY